MTPSSAPLTLPYSDNFQRNLTTYLSALRDLAYRTDQPAQVFETEVSVFLNALAEHFGPNAQKVFLWCKHFSEGLLAHSDKLLEPVISHETPALSTFSDGEYLEVLEQTRQYLKRLVMDMAHDLLGRTPDNLRFYLRGLASVVPPDGLKTLLLSVQQTAESYLCLGYDVYQPANQFHLNKVDQGRNQVSELQKHLTDGHALANFISWRLLKFRKILWFHLVPTPTYSEMADACMAFFANEKRL